MNMGRISSRFAALLLVLLLIAEVGAAGAGARRSLTVVTWNVENLFDSDNDPANDWDEAYTPGGWARWTPERYKRKVENLAEVIRRLEPDILCLQEVENRAVLEALRGVLRRDHAFDLPHILHRHGQDFRGMDVAIMSRIAPAAVEWITPKPGRRDVQIATFAPGGRRLIIVNNHWKSRFVSHEEALRVEVVDQPGFDPQAGNIAIRTEEAAAVRAWLDAHLSLDPSASVLVLGDFNDDIDDPIPLMTALFLVDRIAVLRDPAGRALYNLSAELLPEERGTYFFAREERWNSFDAIAVSRGMLPEAPPAVLAPWRVKPGSYAVYRPAFLRGADGRPRSFRRIRDRDGRWVYSYGYSDHFPVRVVVEASGAGRSE